MRSSYIDNDSNKLTRVKEIAEGFTKRSEFKRAYQGLYKWACENGRLEEVCAHMPARTPRKSDPNRYDAVKVSALRFGSLKEFRLFAYNDYLWAHSQGLIGEFCAHMTRASRRGLTIESVIESAKRFDSRVAFFKGAGADYQWASKNGVLEEVCAHMTVLLRSVVTLEEVMESAKRFKTRGEFQKGARNDYAWAIRNEAMKEVCAHMDSRVRRATREIVADAALKFSTRGAFYEGDPKNYSWAWKNGVLDEVCAHMVSGAGGFQKSKSATLYSRSCSGDGIKNGVVKVGVTNRCTEWRAKMFRPMKGYSTILISSVYFEDGRHCANVERYIKNEYRSSRYEVGYDGPAFLKNGMTEVFTRDIFTDWLESEHGRETLSKPGVRLERIGA
jgi:hypothetical protein